MKLLSTHCFLLGIAASFVSCSPITDTDQAVIDRTSDEVVFDVVATIANARELGSIIKQPEITLHLQTEFRGDSETIWSISGYECGFSISEMADCDEELVLSDLEDGQSYLLSVRAKLEHQTAGTTSYSFPDVFAFRVELGPEDSPEPIESGALATELQVGDFYLASVPSGMHITEYSTSKTTGVLSFYRVFNDSDPFYLGNFKCDQAWDNEVVAYSPAGEEYQYCHSTPTRDVYSGANEFRLANNHIEVATDAKLVAETNHERLSISVYDSDYEFMTNRSRFDNLCQNRTVGHLDVPMLNNFFLGTNPETVRFWYCDTTIPAKDGSLEHWKVGTFIDADQFDWDCDACLYPRAVEMVYMMRPYQGVLQPSFFARLTQERVLEFLSKVAP